MKDRAPKLERAPQLLGSKILTERTMSVLEALARYRLLSTSQILMLVPGNAKVTHRHL